MNKIKLKGLVDEDFTNYKKPSMFIIFPKCSFKCDKECGEEVCQNSSLALAPEIFIEKKELVKRYIENPLTKAIVFGGLEPFDSLIEMLELIEAFRAETKDDIVIYTGYTEKEVYDTCYKVLARYPNIIVKFGRFLPNEESHLDKILGVELASKNQYTKKIS